MASDPLFESDNEIGRKPNWFALGYLETLVFPRFCGVGILESVVPETRKEGHTCRTVIHPSSVAESSI